MQACQNQVFGGRLGVVMDVAIGTTFLYVRTRAHAPRNDEQAEHRVRVETASPIITLRPGRIGSDQGRYLGSPDQFRLEGRTHWPAVPSGLCRWPGPVALHLQEGTQAARSTFHPDRGTRLAANGGGQTLCVVVLEVVF